MDYVMQPEYYGQDNTKSRVAPDELDQLYVQLERLLTQHQTVLETEFARDDIECLMHWVEGCQDGSISAERELYEQGQCLLANVKHRLDLALAEQQRIVDESPANACHTSGRETERYARAARHAEKALCTLSAVVSEKAEA